MAVYFEKFLRETAAVTVSYERIAIVGIGGIFPGARDLATFWQNIAAGIDSGRPVPTGRWALRPERSCQPGGPSPDHAYSDWGCYLDEFSPAFEGLQQVPESLEQLDPLFTIGLHAAAMAWRDARSPQVDPQRAGVIFGHIVLPTESTSGLARDVVLRRFAEQLLGDRFQDWDTTRWSPDNWNAAGLPAAVISAALGMAGPAFTLDAACASSLYALKLACDELQAHRADVMLAGGLSRPDCQYTQQGFSQLQALSKGGRCAPLSAAADGLVVGEGAGLFVLKRLSDALRDGDRIYATIAGIGISNDRGANLLAPRSEGQLRAMQAAYRQAGWQPGDVDLIECHATGTPIGDGVELDSLHALWSEESGTPGRCILGSVKSNIGHLLTAAGGASLMKILWALQTKTLPPTANYQEPAPALNRADSPFRVLSQSMPWPQRNENTPRRAAINAFGFGGINAHVLIEQFLPEAEGLHPLGAFPNHEQRTPPGIAIIGIGTRIGSIDNAREIPANRESAAYAIPEISIPVTEFRIPPLELEDMLPQQQLMLQVAAAALDDAGIPRDLGDRTGVYIGISLDPNTTNFHCRWMIAEYVRDWAQQLGLDLTENELTAWTSQLRDAFGPPLTANRVMGNLGGIVASRLGREFDVGGPCFTISSDEESGLRALDVAIRALQRGDIDQALVGAVDLLHDPRLRIRDSEFNAVDSAVALILQRHADAERAGHRVYAVVEECREPAADAPRDIPMGATGSVSANGDSAKDTGRASGTRHAFAAGAVTSLLPVANAAWSLYHGLTSHGPWTTDYGQFSPWLRDRSEYRREILVQRTGQRDNGSVAGFARIQPLGEKTLNSGESSYEMLNGDGALTWCLAEADSPDSDVTRRELRQPLGELPAALFVIAGSSIADVQSAAAALEELIDGRSPLEVLARRWFQQQPPHADHPLAAAIVVSTQDELRQRLQLLQQRLADGATLIQERGLSFTTQPLGKTGQLAYVFPGSGNHFLGMGRELLTAFPEVLRRQDAENARLWSQYRPDVIWHGESTDAIGRDHKTMIFGQVALGTAVCDWLSLFRVRPHAAIGYSLGESAALFGLRAWRDRDEMLRRMEASSLFGSDLPRPFDAARRAWDIPDGVDVPWLSGVIDRGPREVRPLIEQTSRAYLLIINTPTQCVIGGDRDQIEQIAERLQANFVPFPAPSTVHCPILKEVSQAYTELHLMETFPPDGIEFYSGASGQKYGLSREAAAGAILAQAIDTVDFPRVIQNAYRDGVRLFVEIGPGSSCTRMIGEILQDRPHGAWAVTPATSEPVAQALRVLGELIVHRAPVDLTALYGVDTAVPSHQPAQDVGRCVVTPTQMRPWVMPPLPVPTKRVASDLKSTAGKPAVAPQPLSVSTQAPAPLTMPAPSRSPISPRPTATVMSTSAPAPRLISTPTNDPILKAWDRWMTENIAAHEAYLRFSGEAQRLAGEFIANPASDHRMDSEANATAVTQHEFVSPPIPQPLALSPQPASPPRALNYDQCLEFAIGKIGNVLGPMFAEIDQFPTRVRLPDVPLMLVDRILEIEGEPLSMTRGRVVTEKDIRPDDWYLDCGRIPTCLAVESGQADLFLSGWLGIDFQTRGLACYRLLDAVVTFHDALPGPGKTIHYDIRINHFFRQGETYLFRFEFDATVDGAPLLTMRDGCAGFFTQQELAAGQGIVQTALDRQPRPGIRPDDWADLVPMGVESYTDAQLDSLRAGDLASCFGTNFAGLRLRDPVTLPSGRLNLVHRVLKLDPTAGKYGLGQIRAEADIHPDDWFLTCHFCDDQVMPGTLMYECCLHTLRIYLLRMGWIGEQGEVAYEPIPGVRSRLKCRGQVLSSTKKVWYEVTLKEIGYAESRELRVQSREPNQGDSLSTLNSQPSTPYAIADALMYADGKPIVEITDMTVRLSGLTREQIESVWAEGQGLSAKGSNTENQTNAPPPLSLSPQPSTLSPLFNTERITAFAIGKPSDAFGDRYRVFDAERRIARLPGPPFQFLDRIVSIRDCEPWVLAAGGTIVAEYDVPPDAWYFAASRSPTMPFAVLLETALQPCGWLAAYLGSALTSETDLKFRNLGGKATQYQPVTPNSGTLATTVKITRVSQSAGMIIQHFDFDLHCNGEPVYVGNTYFGFFSKDALANQIGIRDAKVYQPSAAELSRAKKFPVPLEPPFPDDQWCMVRRVDALVMDGGPHGLGYVRGSVDVDPAMWFFQAHFYEDPVWPGSLGLESFLQLLQVYAWERWGEGLGLRAKGLGTNAGMRPAFALTLSPQPSTLSRPHEWIYRGQVIPVDKTVTVDVVVTAVDDAVRTVTAEGFLTVDGRVIYQMKDFTITMTI